MVRTLLTLLHASSELEGPAAAPLTTAAHTAQGAAVASVQRSSSSSGQVSSSKTQTCEDADLGVETLTGIMRWWSRRTRNGQHSPEVRARLQSWAVENRRRPLTAAAGHGEIIYGGPKTYDDRFGPFLGHLESEQLLDEVHKLPGGESFNKTQLQNWCSTMRLQDW